MEKGFQMSKGSQRILVPIDVNEDWQELNEFATNVASENDARIVYVFVAPPMLPRTSGIAARDFEIEVANQYERFRKITPDHDGIKFEHEFVRGNAAQEIIETAQEKRCDLIVIGTHGRKGLSRLILGSVAEKVIRTAHCPVLSFRPQPVKRKKGDENVSVQITS